MVTIRGLKCIRNDSLVAIDVIQLHKHRFCIMEGQCLHKIPYSQDVYLKNKNGWCWNPHHILSNMFVYWRICELILRNVISIK